MMFSDVRADWADYLGSRSKWLCQARSTFLPFFRRQAGTAKRLAGTRKPDRGISVKDLPFNFRRFGTPDSYNHEVSFTTSTSRVLKKHALMNAFPFPEALQGGLG